MSANVTTTAIRKWAALGILIALVFAIAAAGSAVTVTKIPTWYAGLIKPPFNPPPWVFGPVWTLLYVLMAVAAWRVWLAPAQPERRQSLIWFAVQLGLNAAWSQVFFGLERPGLAFVVILALLAAIGMTIWRFLAVDRVAGLMLAPYLLWVAFATVLNGTILVLN